MPELRRREAWLRSAASDVAPGPAWSAAFAGADVAVIAEVKRRSPSAGAIALDLNPGSLAREYEVGGARAVSVLTNEPFFGGTLADVESVRATTGLPVLRKDFIVDPVQLYETRAIGASATLLIVRALEQPELCDLQQLASELGLGTLIEVHDMRELERALAVGPECVGVNSRDLTTFSVDVNGMADIVSSVPNGIATVAESGLQSRSDVEKVAAWGADAVLIGTALSSASAPARAIEQLVGVKRRDRS
ncbi:MAG: indole-3-glycerol-phosphate synthase [Gemmatimonadota bacterium]|nr:MAG: indole-3-glycerol-phosphate synthase [Gemmatimonadota bacterium]